MKTRVNPYERAAVNPAVTPVLRRMATRCLLACIAVCAPWLAAAPALAQPPAYPAKPIRLVVPFAAGGPADVLGRAVGEGIAKATGQSVLGENKARAAGPIRLAPVVNCAVNPPLLPHLPYKPADLAPVAMLATAENVLVVNAATPVKSLAELLK